jgi:Fe-S cluster biosynthesis and repair protein YggX
VRRPEFFVENRLVNCVKLGKELPGMAYPPFPGALGERIYLNVSQEAWKMFLEHFKMVMNEYRLQGGTEQATNAFYEQAEKFFFGEGAQLPPDYKPHH